MLLMTTQPWEPRVSRLEAAFEMIVERLADMNLTLDRRLADMQRTMDQRFEAAEKRMDRLEDRVGGIARDLWKIVWIVIGSSIVTIGAGFLHH